MAGKKHLSEAETLEQYRVSFENVGNQSEIAAIMAEFGFDEALITAGKALYTKTRDAYNFNKKEDDETSETYINFTVAKENLSKIYTLHRKKAKVIFRNDPNILNKLALTGSLPTSYIKWLEVVKKFYSVAIGNTEIETKLLRLKVTSTDLTNAVAKIGELTSARAEYLKEKGESQDSTMSKDKAFREIDDWMSEFYAVAKIALEEKPQLLESLGKFVRN